MGVAGGCGESAQIKVTAMLHGEVSGVLVVTLSWISIERPSLTPKQLICVVTAGAGKVIGPKRVPD